MAGHTLPHIVYRGGVAICLICHRSKDMKDAVGFIEKLKREMRFLSAHRHITNSHKKV